jgi:hypothetical protein
MPRSLAVSRFAPSPSSPRQREASIGLAREKRAAFAASARRNVADQQLTARRRGVLACVCVCVCEQFTQADWTRHKSTNRYWRHVRTMPVSSIIQGLIPPVLFFTLDAFLFGLYNTEVPVSNKPH